MKKYLYLIILVFCINISFACQDIYDYQENVTISDIIIDSGVGALCKIKVYNNNGTKIIEQDMINSSNFYTLNIEKLELGNYLSKIECNKSNTLYYGECNFKVEKIGEKTKMNAINISLIIQLLFFLIIGLFILYITKAKELENQSLSFWIVFICFGITIIQIPMIVGINYLNYIGTDITNILKINFYVVSLLLFFVGIIALFFVQLNVFDLTKVFKNKEKW